MTENNTITIMCIFFVGFVIILFMIYREVLASKEQL